MVKRTSDQYDILLKVAETGSITKAADILKYSQSNISRVVSDLEEEFGVPLFKRTPKGVELTPQGRSIIPEIEKIIEQDRLLHEKVWNMANHVSGLLRVGCFTSINISFLPFLLNEFIQEYPDVKFVLEDGSFEIVAQLLRQGVVDVAFLPEPYAKGLEFRCLFHDPMMVIFPPDHRFKEKEVVTLEDLEKEPMIIQTKGNNCDILDILDNSEIFSDSPFSFSEEAAVMKMVEEGYGTAIVPSLMVKNSCRDILARPLHPAKYRKIGMAVVQGNRSLLVETFYYYARDLLEESGDYILA